MSITHCGEFLKEAAIFHPKWNIGILECWAVGSEEIILIVFFSIPITPPLYHSITLPQSCGKEQSGAKFYVF